MTAPSTLTENAWCKVHYEVTDAFTYALNCHCSNCRRATGAAFEPFAGVARAALTVTQGRDRLLVYGSETNDDAHYARCGSMLYSLVRDAAYACHTGGAANPQTEPKLLPIIPVRSVTNQPGCSTGKATR